jgi:hypothetical protein
MLPALSKWSFRSDLTTRIRSTAWPWASGDAPYCAWTAAHAQSKTVTAAGRTTRGNLIVADSKSKAFALAIDETVFCA